MANIPENEHHETEVPSDQKQDSLTWIQSFREFRDALYQGDKSKVKSFIDFPISHENNEIWYLAHAGDNEFDGQTNKPFTESDFDKYHDKVFPKSFINSILKIKTGELYNKGETETIKLKDSHLYTVITYAAFDQHENTLTLNVAYEGEMDEYNVIYTFQVIKNGELKFRKIRIAG